MVGSDAGGDLGGSDEGRVHWTLGTTIFINALVGVGLFNFPESMHNAGGIPISILIQAVSRPSLSDGERRGGDRR